MLSKVFAKFSVGNYEVFFKLREEINCHSHPICTVFIQYNFILLLFLKNKVRYFLN